jgi:hypothetical protein
MKKLRIYIALIGLSILFILTACTKKKSCDELANDVSTAATAFGMNPNAQTCQDYVNAINDYYDGCKAIPAAEKAALDQWVNSNPCAGF